MSNRSSHQDELTELAAAARAVTDQVETDFGGLSTAQLNWKPGPDHWSIAQCLDHLLITNERYFPIFERVLSGEKKSKLWERMPVLPTLWGKMFLHAVSPEARHKAKAPKSFQPAASDFDADIIRRFADQQERTIRYIQAAERVDVEGIVVSSPVSGLITFRLIDAFRIAVAHEQRHLLQAQRVAAMEGFSPG